MPDEQDKVEAKITEILERHFKDPIDIPCPYCEATKEILSLLPPELTLISDDEIQSIKLFDYPVIDKHSEARAIAQAQLEHNRKE